MNRPQASSPCCPISGLPLLLFWPALWPSASLMQGLILGIALLLSLALSRGLWHWAQRLDPGYPGWRLFWLGLALVAVTDWLLQAGSPLIQQSLGVYIGLLCLNSLWWRWHLSAQEAKADPGRWQGLRAMALLVAIGAGREWLATGQWLLELPGFWNPSPSVDSGGSLPVVWALGPSLLLILLGLVFAAAQAWTLRRQRLSITADDAQDNAAIVRARITGEP